jgi:uncharacterized protein (TIGR03435 family)
MYQNLLAAARNLKFHIETKQGPVYALTVDTPGSKMKGNDSPQDFKIPINFGPNGVVAIRVSMPYFCWWLGQQVQGSKRPVINLTGLEKNTTSICRSPPSYRPTSPEKRSPPSSATDPRSSRP